MTRTLLFAGLAGLAIAGAAWADTAADDVQYHDGAVDASLTGKPGDPAEGKKVLTTRALGNCVACHQVAALPDVAFQGNIAPPLDGVAGRYSEAQLRGIVSDAKKMFQGTMMPSFYKDKGYIRPGDAFTGKAAPPEGLTPLLTATQIEDVVAYLMTLK